MPRSKQASLTGPLAEATDRVNEMAKEQFAQRALACAKSGDTLAVFGIAYRPGTHITEESAGT